MGRPDWSPYVVWRMDDRKPSRRGVPQRSAPNSDSRSGLSMPPAGIGRCIANMRLLTPKHTSADGITDGCLQDRKPSEIQRCTRYYRDMERRRTHCPPKG